MTECPNGGLGSRIACKSCAAESFANGATIHCARCFSEARAKTLREAIDWCSTQVWDRDNPEPPTDEYRRGQKRGAMDCVTMLTRLLGEETGE